MRIQRVGDRVLSIGGPRFVAPRGGAAAANWWEAGGATGAILVYQAKGAASKNAAMVNLVAPGTYNLVEVGSVPWAADTGFDPSYSNYFTTGYTPASTDQDYTLILQGSTVVGFGGAGVNRLYVWMREGDVVYGNGASLIVAPSLASGNTAVSGNTAYRDGVPESGSMASNAAARLEVYVGELNGINAWPTGYFHAGALFRPALSAEKVAAVAAAMAGL